MAHAVTLMRGDEGPEREFASLLQRLLEAAGAQLTWTEFTPAAAHARERGALLESVRATGCMLETWAPAGDAGPDVLPASAVLAGDLALDVCVHPCRSYAGVPGAHPGVDLMLWRGTTEGPYARAELRSREAETVRLASDLAAAAEVSLDPESGFSVLASTRAGAERVIESAFEFARERGRAHLRVGTLTDALHATDGLFLHTARNVAVRFPEVAFSDWPIGDLCRELARAPAEFDVVVVPPLWGLPLAELAAGLVGGPSCAPHFHLGAGGAVLFGAAWPAPKKVCGTSGQSPWGVVLSSIWMLRHLGEANAAQRLERALADLLARVPEPGPRAAAVEPLLAALA